MNRQNYTSETLGKLFLWLTFLLFVAVSAGCAESYPGAGLLEEQAATFTTVGLPGAEVQITHVDGKAMPFIFGNRTLVPGEHTISMKIGPPGTKTSRDLTFNALAGHKYEIVPRPSAFGGQVIEVAIIGYFQGMWEAVILDRNTGETVANSARVNDRKTTLIGEPASTLLLQDQRIEVLLEKWGKTELESSLVMTATSAIIEAAEKSNSSTGNIFFVIRATVTKIKDVLLLHFGGSKAELSRLRDDTGNTYKVYYWETKGSLMYIKPDWFRSGKTVFGEDSPITLIFIIPEDATPTHLTLVYYYMENAGGYLEKGIIEIKLPSEQ